MLESILTVERTKARLDGVSKKRAFECVAKIFSDNIDHFDIDELYQHLINREKLGTTGIGGGIAIPHCRFNTGGETYCACISFDKAIDYDAVDNQPVDIIIAMLVPEDAQDSHLQLLASLAEKLQHPGFVQSLRKADTDQHLFNAAIETLK